MSLHLGRFHKVSVSKLARNAASILVAMLALAVSVPGIAQSTEQSVGQIDKAHVTGDLFSAAERITIDQQGTDDVFVAAQSLRILEAITGTAHVLAASVDVEAPIDKSAFVLAEDIDVSAGVAQDAYLIGANVNINAPVAGDVRAIGETVSIRAPIDGDLMVAADYLIIDGSILGDATIAAGHIEFGKNAKIGGKVTIYEEAARDASAVESAGQIPSHVVQATKVERVAVSFEEENYSHDREGFWSDFLGGVAFVTVLAFGLALVFRQSLVNIWSTDAMSIDADTKSGLKVTLMRVLQGAFMLALAVGGAIVGAITIIGLPITFILTIVIAFGCLFAYILSAYIIGAKVWHGLLGRAQTGVLNILIASLVGALIVEIVTLIPVLGGLVTIALIMYGVGVYSPWGVSRRVS